MLKPGDKVRALECGAVCYDKWPLTVGDILTVIEVFSNTDWDAARSVWTDSVVCTHDGNGRTVWMCATHVELTTETKEQGN